MAAPSYVTIHTSVLFDPKTKSFLTGFSMRVDRETGTLADIFQRASDDGITGRHGGAGGGDEIDLRGRFVMPGLVDSHTHIFLHSYDERSGHQQMRDESVAERIVRATNHLRAALLAGFTTYRDLGSEAMESHDASVRDCVNRGLIPGPRLFVATHAIASSGSYEVRTENRGAGRARMPPASDPADGGDGVRAAVRRRVADGADVVKFYADYRRKAMRFPVFSSSAVRFPPADADRAVPLFGQVEMDAIVREAKLADLPVACHAGTADGAAMAVRAGVTSLEHGFLVSDDTLAEMARTGCIFVPTLTVAERFLSAPDFDALLGRVRRAHTMGVPLAAGGDTGTFPHGENARELELLFHRTGLPLEDVLVAATLGGWEACGGDRCGFRFGWLEKGTRADIVALDSDPRQDPDAFRKVNFVMKDGRVCKRDGLAVGMGSGHAWPGHGHIKSRF